MTREPLVVVTAVRTETRAVLEALRHVRRADVRGLRIWQAESRGRPVTLVQAGIGPARARRALEAVSPPHGPVLSIGFAGALVADAKPGDVALPNSVLWEGPSSLQRYDVPASSWRRIDARVATMNLGATLRGPMLSSSVIVASPEEKRAASRRTGAVAVEMEAAGLVPVACERGVDLLVVRTILDTADVSLAELPADLDSSWSARAALLGRPRAWPSVWAVARHIPCAARNLRTTVAAALTAL